VEIGSFDFQGRRKGLETVSSFSVLSLFRHFRCLVRSSRCLCGALQLLVVPQPFEFVRTRVDKRRVHARAIVPAQSVEHRVLGFANRRETPAVLPFHLERNKQRLAARVVPAVTLVAHRGRVAVRIKKPIEVRTHVLAAAIGVKHERVLFRSASMIRLHCISGCRLQPTPRAARTSRSRRPDTTSLRWSRHR